MSELATRQAVPRQLTPSRVPLDRPGRAAAGLWATRGASASADAPGTPDAPAPQLLTGGVVARGILFGRLAEAKRVVQISASAGSGKTVLVRSWIAESGLAGSAARVT